MSRSLEQRLIDLETAYGLLQHDYEAQNRAVVESQKRIEQLESLIVRLSDQLRQFQFALQEAPRSLEDEKPPHY